LKYDSWMGITAGVRDVINTRELIISQIGVSAKEEKLII